jgi:cardiolipin hydrolase
MGADIYYLAQQGIECTMDKNINSHMHNKFAIIDELVLVTGSFNWTDNAVKSNKENLVIMDNKKFILDYQNEFNKLWELFKDNILNKR